MNTLSLVFSPGIPLPSVVRYQRVEIPGYPVDSKQIFIDILQPEYIIYIFIIQESTMTLKNKCRILGKIRVTVPLRPAIFNLN